MAKKPWYAEEGLQFECTGCGDCCTGEPGHVWVTQEEIVALAKAVEIDLDEFEKYYVRPAEGRLSLVELPSGDCILFDSEKRCCKVYEARPIQCKTWPFWRENIHKPEDWQYTKDECPGCGEGKLYQAEEIRRQAELE